MINLPIACLRKISLSLLLLLALQAGASDLESDMAFMVADRPNAAGPPTEVTIGVVLLDIDNIDDASQRYRADLFAWVVWHDERLALPKEQRTGRIRTAPMDDIWTPRALIINDRGLTAQLPDVADIDDLGNVIFQQRFSGELAADLRYEDFPADTQLLPIDIVSYQYSPDDVHFSTASEIKADPNTFSAEGWQFKVLEPEIGEYTIVGIDDSKPRLRFLIEAERDTRFYMWTIFLPMSLIVFMSWTVFWLQPSIVPARIGISTASIFSLMALGFSIRTSLPKVPYLTRADAFLIGCTLMVFLALAVAVIGSRWASAEREHQALRLNAVARWVYVGLFGVVVAVATAN
jgi:hypothetical protein